MVNRSKIRLLASIAVVLGVSVLGSACGGGGGTGSGGAGTGLVLVNFLQAGVDNVQLNTILQLRFSGAIDPSTIGPAAIQIREGNAFGRTVRGEFEVSGSTVFFRPVLPSSCDLLDGGFLAGTDYSVVVVGFPEQFAIRNPNGQPLNTTTTWGFATRSDSDPEKFADQVPGQAPFLSTCTPVNGNAAELVGDGDDQVTLVMNENIDPCSVNEDSVKVWVYEKGDSETADINNHSVLFPDGRRSGFYTAPGNVAANADDQNPDDPFTWWDGNEPGGVDSTPVTGNMPQRLPATIELVQDFTETKIVISPTFRADPEDPTTAVFPDNALIVVELTFDIQDFGGVPLGIPPAGQLNQCNRLGNAISFTTEKKETATESGFTLKNQKDSDTGETFNPPYLIDGTTARIDGDLEIAQGFLLFAGDGDNGTNELEPSLPQSDYPACNFDYQTNDGAKDDFDPQSNEVLDTGPLNQCANQTDGSTAVVWEFNEFRIRSGRTVRITGANPAIIKAQQGVTIESGGRLLVRGDNTSGVPNSNGQNGQNTNSSTSPKGRAGGTGVAGGGDGGDSKNIGVNPTEDGIPGYGSSDYDPITGVGVEGGEGAGHGNASANKSSFSGGGNSASGGGGGHSTAGLNGTANSSANMSFVGTIDGAGGGTYPAGLGGQRMLEPSAGSGAGAAGYADLTVTSFAGYDSTGGAGAAGGGFVDLTSQGPINVFGEIDAQGGRGGSGAAGFYFGSGGGGGGAGGGVRLLSPVDVNLSGATINTGGGQGGAGSVPTSGAGAVNNGGAGGVGRIVIEDDDSVITGIGAATLIPGDGADGFFRGVFDASRFQGGGLEPQALTDIIAFGPLNPTYLQPVAGDFVAGIPPTAVSLSGPDVSMVIEARAYPMRPDGRPDTTLATEYATIGFFTDSGNPEAPTWNDASPAAPNPADWQPVDNNTRTYHQMTGLRAAADAAFGAGAPIPFIQFRITFLLPPDIGPFDPGPFIDDWTVRVEHIN